MAELRDVGVSLYYIPQFAFAESLYFLFQVLTYLEKIAVAKRQRMAHPFKMDLIAPCVDNCVLVSISSGELKDFLLSCHVDCRLVQD